MWTEKIKRRKGEKKTEREREKKLKENTHRRQEKEQALNLSFIRRS